MNWNDVRFFLEVARAGSLSGAARALGSDHATVSRHIAALEHAVARKLFHRNPLGYRLTTTGAALLPVAEEMESAALRAGEAIGRPQAGTSGRVRIATPDGFGNHFLAHHIGQLSASYPRLAIELVIVPQIMSLPREGDVIVDLTPPARGRYRAEKLTDYELGAFAAQSYLNGAGEIATRADLQGHRFVGYVDDLIFTRELDYLHEVMSGLRAALQITSLQAQLTAALQGCGPCVLPIYVAREHPSLVRLLPNEIALRRSYWLVTHEDNADLPRVRLVQDFLRDCVASQGAFL